MKSFLNTLSFILSLIVFFPSVIKAETEPRSLKVGQVTELVVHNINGFKRTSSWTSSDKETVEVVKNGDYSVTVKVLKYKKASTYIECYYDYSNGSGQKFSFDISIIEPFVNFTVNPSGGNVKKGEEISFDCYIDDVDGFNESDVTVYYTLNGASPNQNSGTPCSVYDKVTINESCTLKAIAVWKGLESKVLEVKYMIDELYVSASHKSGAIKEGTIVTLSCEEPRAVIYYTLDGRDPTQSSTKYTSGIRIDRDCTLKARAYYEGKSSNILEEHYTMKVDPTDIKVYLSSNTVIVGGFINAYYTLKPSNATSNVIWSSDDPSIAKIDRTTGFITGVKVGTTTIRGKTENGLVGSCEVSVGVLSVTSAVAGYSHSFFIKEDGSLWGMGRTVYDYGLIENEKAPHRIVKEDVVSVAAGDGNMRYVTKGGSLYGCGSNTFGQLSDAKQNKKGQFRFIMNDVASVAGQLCSHIIKKDGSLWACGLNSNGNLGDGTTKNQSKPVHIMDNVSYVSSGGNHTLIIKKDGSLWACGSNDHGQLGDGSTKKQTTPIKVMEDVAFASAGGGSSLIIKKDGSLWACGSNSYGQLCDGTTYDMYRPTKIMDGVSFVETRLSSFIIKNDGTLWVCGSNDNGQLGTGTRKTQRNYSVHHAGPRERNGK